MINFETYLMWKLILAVVGTVVGFPIAMWWLNNQNRQRKKKNHE
jgi:hypothetical protein